MVIQKLLRVYPIGWTGNSIGELNRHLSQGWQVKFITDIGKNIHDYIIEKEDGKHQSEVASDGD